MQTSPQACRRPHRIADISSAEAAELLTFFTELRSVSTRDVSNPIPASGLVRHETCRILSWLSSGLLAISKPPGLLLRGTEEE